MKSVDEAGLGEGDVLQEDSFLFVFRLYPLLANVVAAGRLGNYHDSWILQQFEREL